jgi:GTP-binding protein EngB required for normal cell division
MKLSEVRDKLSKIAEASRDKMPSKPNPLSFLLVGRTGVGKSSTINTLLGAEVAPTGKYRPTTLEVKKHWHSHNDIKYAIIDTPGLCDDLPEAGNDKKYLNLIKSQVGEIDSLWYVTRLDDTRLGADERRGIKLVSRALGSQVWKRAVIVFTFADAVKPAEFAEAMAERTKIIREEIAKYAPAESSSIPSVAVTNSGPTTPDGAEWLGELFTVVVERFNEAGMLPFLVSMQDDVKPKKGAGKSANPRITLSEKQKARVRKSLVDRVFEGARMGAEAGARFGPWGAVIGGVLGGSVGALLSWLFEEPGES